MRKWSLDFVFDEASGQCRLLIDFNDASLTTLEINTMIRDGELRDEVIGLAGELFGEELAARLHSGDIPLVCLDDEPETTRQAPQREWARDALTQQPPDQLLGEAQT